MSPHQKQRKPSSDSPASPLAFRSGSVARLAGMPVSTLRIWEQRYQAIGPTTSASGHRLYSAADVERVVLLRQLTQAGHAIGSVAGLDMSQLQGLALACPPAGADASAGSHALGAPLNIVVVGLGMAGRLKRAAVFRRWARRPNVVAVFASLADAAQAGRSADHAHVDLLLWQATGLHGDAADELTAAQTAWQPRKLAITYRFAGATARDALTGMGLVVVQEPADDDALGAWLADLACGLAQADVDTPAGQATPPFNPWAPEALGLANTPAPPRRFDDAALTAFASLPSSVPCECPRHLAELLVQIASFEAYSADCHHRNAADAALHGYLHRIAGAARVLFEAALERVATEEGLPLA